MSVEMLTKAVEDIGRKFPEFSKKVTADLAEIREAQEKSEGQILELAQKMAGGYSGVPGGTVKTGLQAAIRKAITSDRFEAFRRNEAATTGAISLGIETKELLSLQGGSGSAGGVDITRTDLGIGLQVFKPITVLESLNQRPVDGNTFGSNKVDFVGGTNSANYQLEEGAEKAEQQLEANWIEAPIVTVAVHTTLSRQVLADAATLQNSVDQILRYGLSQKVDSELLNGAGGTGRIHGLLTQASTMSGVNAYNRVDRIGATAAYLRGLGYMPSHVYVHPEDYFSFVAERDNENGYVGAGWSTPPSGTIHGLKAVITPSIAEGTALVMDNSVVIVGMREAATVEMSREHNTNFTRNLVTLLAEMRLGMLMFDTDGALKVDLEAS